MKSKLPRLSGALLLVLALTAHTHAAVNVGSTNTALCATVPLFVRLLAPTGAVSAQFDLGFAPNALLGVGAAGDRSLTGFRVDGFSELPGKHRVLVWAPDNRPLPASSGVNVLLYVTTNALPSNVVTITETLLSGVNGTVISAGTTTPGSVRVGPVNDLKPPTLTISFPAPNARVVSTSGVFNLRGTVKDNVGVCGILWRLNGGQFQSAQAITNWVAVAQARLGLNTLEAKALDGSGRESLLITRNFTWMPADTLVLDRIGLGAISGATNGQVLELGKSYTITARPSRNWLFTGWSGGTNSENATLRFMMRSNLTLRATFVTNLFPTVAGSWNGLVRESPPRPESSGLLTLSLTPIGVFSGKLLLNGASLNIQGHFKPDGTLAASITRPGRTPLRLELQAPLGNPDAEMPGVVSDMDWTAVTESFRNPWTGRGTNTAPWHGTYTAIIPGFADSQALPGGAGSLTMTVTPSGIIKGSGMLGDLSAVTFAGSVNRFGQWPFFASASVGRETLLGWATFAESSDADLVADELHWLRLANTGPIYPPGFTNATVLDGSRYQLKKPILNWTNGTVTLTGGNLIGPLSADATLTANRFVVTGTNGLTLTLTPASGRLKGEFVHPQTGQRTPLRGAVHQKKDIAVGAFTGTNAAGRLLLEAP